MRPSSRRLALWSAVACGLLLGAPAGAGALDLAAPLAPLAGGADCLQDTQAAGATCAGRVPGLLGAASLVLVGGRARTLAVAAPDDDAVALLGLDPSAGTLVAGSCVGAVGASSCPIQRAGLHGADAVTSVGDRLLVGASDDRSVVELAGNRETGCVTGTSVAGCRHVAGLDDVVALAADPAGRFVYAISTGLDVGLDTVVALTRARGRLGPVVGPGRCVASLGPGRGRCPVRAAGLEGADAAAISPDGRTLYVASRTSSAVAILARDRHTGGLAPVGCVGVLNRVGDGDRPCALRVPALQGADAVAVAPDGRTVYVAAADPGGVIALRRNRRTGALLAQVGCLSAIPRPTCATVPAMHGARALAFGAAGGRLVIAADAANALTTVPLDPATGGFGVTGAPAPEIGDLNFPGALAADGDRLYVASPYDDGVLAMLDPR